MPCVNFYKALENNCPSLSVLTLLSFDLISLTVCLIAIRGTLLSLGQEKLKGAIHAFLSTMQSSSGKRLPE